MFGFGPGGRQGHLVFYLSFTVNLHDILHLLVSEAFGV